MASLTKVLLCSVSDPGAWTSSVGANTTATEGVTGDSDTVAGHTDTTALEMAISGRSKSNANFWTWAGTWENLGIPAGSVVTNVQLVTDWRCSTFTTGASSTVGPEEFRDSADTLQGTFLAGSAFSATGSWATRTGSNLSVPSGLQASNSTIHLRLNDTLVTGASNTAAVKLHQAYVQVVMTYTPFKILTPAAVNATATVTATITDVPAPKPPSFSLHAVPLVDHPQNLLESRFFSFAPAAGGTKTVTPASIGATATVTAQVVKTAAISPTVNATATVTASVVKTAVIVGTVNATSTVTASLVKTAVLAPTVHATTTVTVSLVKTAVLAPGVNATSTVTAQVVKTAVLAPTINATASVVATFSGTAAPAAKGFLLYAVPRVERPPLANESRFVAPLVETLLLSGVVNAVATVTTTIVNATPSAKTPDQDRNATFIVTH